jgi:flagellar protein FlaJ
MAKKEKVKKIKAAKETNWLVVSWGLGAGLMIFFVLLAVLAQMGTLDLEGEADVIFDEDGAPIHIVDHGEDRVWEVIENPPFTEVHYYTMEGEGVAISGSQARDILNENPNYEMRSLKVDKGYELGKPPTESLRIDGDFMNFIIIAMIPICAIPGIYITRHDKNIHQIEDRLPDFLRDVAEAGRFGMTLADAIVVASGGRYGKLTPEIKKMASRIDWGVPANDAISLFADKVKTPLVNRVAAIIMKSNDAGGNVADVLTLVANDTKQVQIMDKERKLSMSTYIAVIYISFFVFLFTILILNATFLPQMREAGEETSALVSGDGASVQIIQTQAISAIQFSYLIASLAHAVGDGLIAGALSNGKVKNGLVHSFILLIAAFFMLRLLLYL